MELTVPLQILLAFALGAVIGLEREINERKTDLTHKKPTAILGLRTFSLTAGLGAIAGVFFVEQAVISAIITVGLLALLITFYIFDAIHAKDVGITTEIALIYSYVIGFLLTTGAVPIILTIALTIILTLLLSRKETIKEFVTDIQKHEVNALISFAILAFVILPFLPDKSYSFADIPGLRPILQNFALDARRIAEIDLLNPFKLWMIVVLITGIDLGGYLLEKLLGKSRGWILASVAGGFVSSTATTVSLAKESKESSRTNLLLASALFANAASFVPILFIIAAVNFRFLILAFPTLFILFAATVGFGVYYLLKSRGDTEQRVAVSKHEHTIFDLATALKFAGLFLLVSATSKIALELIGTGGFLVASALGALPGIDAVTINTSQLAGDRISMELAVFTFVLINAVNFASKSFYSYTQGKREFALKLMTSLGISIVLSLVGLLFV